jgi:cohesin loading factor subunit SCC2
MNLTIKSCLSWKYGLRAWCWTQSGCHESSKFIALGAHNRANIRASNFQAVTAPQSQLAAGIITLQQPFCQYYEHIVNTMLQQMQTQDTAVKVKSGAIKSIESFLDKDPQALPEKSIMGVISLLHDNSPLVRTDAVSLVSKCLKRNPNLERHFLHSVLGLTIDPSNGPKKKAINLLKDLYSETKTNQHKLDISASLLPPSQDHEESVADLARQTLEGIWLGTPNADGRVDEHRLKLHRQQRASVLVETVQRIQGQAEHLAAFESFFANALAKKASNAAKNASICSELVADMVEGVISPETLGANCSQVHVLTTLSILARVRPGLITQDQLQLLKLYIKNPATSDDLAILRPTATIFRVVLPHMPYLQSTFADEVWKLLTATLSKLASLAGRGNAAGKSTLADVVQCTWMMVPLATGGVNLLSTIVSSVMVQLSPFSSSTHRITPAEENRISSYLVLLGTLGKFFNFDNDKDADVFRTKLSDMIQKHLVLKKATSDQLKGLLNLGTKAPSVILLDTVRPFAKQPWSLTIREHALGSVGEICQGAPSLFMRVDVQKMFQLVFTNDVSSLKQVALTQFHDFFIVAEKPTDTSNDTNEDSVQVGRLGTTFIAGEGQVTTNFLARHLLSEIVNIALTHDNELAHLATCIIASISRQGLVHPKECGPALIALGSSSNPQIAEIAVTEHRKIHEQHESMFEKEYMAAITMAFEYQRTVFNDTHGMVASTYKPKLLHVFNALKGGQRKTLKKFIVNLCKHMDFELTSLEGNAAGSTAVLFARFCLENMALLDAVKLEDVSLMLNALESIVLKNTGPSVGVAIETELPKSGTIGPAADTVLPAEPMPQQQQEVANGTDAVLEPPASRDMDQRKETLSDARLVQVTQACIILQMMWETRSFIRKAYNLGNLTGRIAQKDFQKPAQRNNLISGKELWERLEPILDSMGSRETMMQRCYNFAELLEVDKDAQLGDDDGDGNDGDDMGYATPDEGGEELAVPTSGRGRKRKSSVPNGNTPKKARGRPAGGKNKKQNSRTPDLDGWN